MHTRILIVLSILVAAAPARADEPVTAERGASRWVLAQ